MNSTGLPSFILHIKVHHMNREVKHNSCMRNTFLHLFFYTTKSIIPKEKVD